MTSQATVDRIPIGHSIVYAVRGMPDVPNHYGPGFLVPTEISLTYRTTEDSQLGRVHAYVKGQWRRDGEVVPSGEKLPGQHYYGDPQSWPEWLAAEARRHDPETAVSIPPPVLSTTERDMLRYALDLAQEQMFSRGDEFTEDDQAAVDSLRRMTEATS